MPKRKFKVEPPPVKIKKVKKAKPVGRPRKLSTLDESFFKTIGAKGGERTLKNNGADFFREIAKASHAARRRNTAARVLAEKSRAKRRSGNSPADS